jgi:hypothetical protein
MARTAQNSTHLAIENYVNAVEQQGGLLTYYPVVINNSLTADSITLSGSLTADTLSLSESTVAISGTTAATLGDTGGSTGPATAAQNSWMPVEVDGVNYFVPLWK